ncbi:hypothetical protein Tco_0378950 [Tanacetum coccineum]
MLPQYRSSLIAVFRSSSFMSVLLLTSFLTAATSCVHCMFFLSVQLLSTLKKGRDLSAPFDRNWLRAATFSLRLFPIDRNGSGDACHISMSPRKDICVGEVSRIFFTPSPILSNLCVENTVPIPWMVWNLTAPWIVETTIPIFCIAVLPNSIFYGELDLTMMKLRFSLLERGVSPIVISKELLQ